MHILFHTPAWRLWLFIDLNPHHILCNEPIIVIISSSNSITTTIFNMPEIIWRQCKDSVKETMNQATTMSENDLANSQVFRLERMMRCCVSDVGRQAVPSGSSSNR